MARIRFKKPKIAVLMSEIISLTIWLFLGDKVIGVLDGLIGAELDVNLSPGNAGYTSVEGCTNNSVFKDAYEILGLGYDCGSETAGVSNLSDISNTGDGLLGVIGLVMVVMVLMNFISYN